MLPIFSLFWRIAQLKSGPEHLPASSFLLLTITLLNIAVSLVISLSIGTQPATTIATTILTNLAAQALIISGLLALVGKGARLTRRSAYFGCDLLLNLVMGAALFLCLLSVDFMTTLALIIFSGAFSFLGTFCVRQWRYTWDGIAHISLTWYRSTWAWR